MLRTMLKKFLRDNVPTTYHFAKILYNKIKWYRNRNYEKNISRLQYVYKKRIYELKTKDNIRIAIVITSSAKWGFDMLYKLLMNFGFDPFVLLCLRSGCSEKEYIRELKFFEKIRVKAYPLFDWDKKRHILIKKYRPDIIIYTECWHLSHKNFPLKTSKFALNLLIPYSIAKTDDNISLFEEEMLLNKSVYKNFVFDMTNKKIFEKYGMNNCLPVGHPKLDGYLAKTTSTIWRTKNKLRIIYAPHHSFAKESLGWATFKWSGIPILHFAQQTADTTEWIFKPHPAWRSNAIKSGIFSEQEINAYIKQWEDIGQIYLDGGYINIFKTSNLLITDCGSFLTEYLPSGNPVIHLISNKPWATPQSFINSFSATYYYKAETKEKLLMMLNSLVILREDPLKNQRIAFAKKIPLGASFKILKYLESILQP